MEDKQKKKTFYWYFKPIAVICKCLGIFPIQNVLSSDDAKNLTAKRLSLAYLYTFTIYICNIYIIYYFSGFIFTTYRSIYLIIVVYVIVGRSFICFVFCSTYAKNLPRLLNLLDSFDRKKNYILIQTDGNSTLKHFTQWTLLPLVLGILTLIASFIESKEVVTETLPPEQIELNKSFKAAVYFFGYLSIWQVVPLLLYIYFALKICSNYNLINETIKKRGYTGSFLYENIEYPVDMDKSLEYLRHMHSLVTKAVNELGKSYGNFLAIDQLVVIIMVIANVCTFVKEKTHETHLLILTCFSSSLVVVLFLVSDIVKEVGFQVLDLLQGIQFSRVSDKSRIEIQTFMIQIKVLPPKISAGGFFTIDKRQIPAVLTSIATYLVVSLQFIDDTEIRTLSTNSTCG